MKNYIISLFLIVQFLPAIASGPSYEIHGNYSRAIKKETLLQAKLIRDIIPGYATNWITEYVSVEMIATNNGKLVKEQGSNEKINPGQKKLLSEADLFSHIVINVKYRNQNPATGQMDTREMSVSMTVIPEMEAEFIGGTEKMMSFLKENAIDKIDGTIAEYILDGVITFTIDEAGKISNARLTKSTGHDKTDQLLIDVINKMPKWKPAMNSWGIKVKQDFEFRVGNKGC